MSRRQRLQAQETAGIFFGWVSFLISSAHLHVRPVGGASYVQMGGRNRINPHQPEIERLGTCKGPLACGLLITPIHLRGRVHSCQPVLGRASCLCLPVSDFPAGSPRAGCVSRPHSHVAFRPSCQLSQYPSPRVRRGFHRRRWQATAVAARATVCSPPQLNCNHAFGFLGLCFLAGTS